VSYGFSNHCEEDRMGSGKALHLVGSAVLMPPPYMDGIALQILQGQGWGTCRKRQSMGVDFSPIKNVGVRCQRWVLFQTNLV
jgi:hypothetical protein